MRGFRFGIPFPHDRNTKQKEVEKMREITKLENTVLQPVKRKRVAAYARVSSGKDAQIHSLSAQISYYNNYIGRRGDWELAGIYADEAMTGTKENRPQFQKLLSDCRAGKIDMVIAKSITRLARNTVTLLETARELKALEIDIYFEKKDFYTGKVPKNAAKWAFFGSIWCLSGV